MPVPLSADGYAQFAGEYLIRLRSSAWEWRKELRSASRVIRKFAAGRLGPLVFGTPFAIRRRARRRAGVHPENRRRLPRLWPGHRRSEALQGGGRPSSIPFRMMLRTRLRSGFAGESAGSQPSATWTAWRH